MNINKNKIILSLEDTKISNHLPIVVFGGINVLEDYDTTAMVCEKFITITKKLNMSFIFKASFDKANRSSIYSYRGPGLKKSIEIFSKIKSKFNVKIMTDIHEPNQAHKIAEVVDIIQIPAFLARQTDLIQSAAQTNKIINIKKPQFISPEQIYYIVEKIIQSGNSKIILCERGTTFGYNNLIVDMLGLDTMKKISGGYPVMLDITHALQMREKFSPISHGKISQIHVLARSGVAVGISSILIETHPEPKKARCDGPCALPLKNLELLLTEIKHIDNIVKSIV
ncbi:3-deoxy-D-manno-octulosonate 8-phosphate synthase [Wigglesworthia glossinidia endosymbiont of Glossina morsitans morsitans (Yale colony)]|uniref:3-deoxy-8-phosphooctulonate synthase n=1 Tax=Wigglesworthia glossinidia endosymbiont of Glossina morsitans morsitans (Yale colony) TaxID=1142511 RepID=H6Q4X2_WIGGL|nr:3-deoxy-8-phosphooctulonate synthase [Wigglesworthia glossinidia]AFA41255.1 3-deoxy-D-manno-octulosonate 8-phosphate synthase [Wigglesworthia glossinidia endosymbiont of Glossina morsitans morsitans (Yale colony)]